MKIKFEGIEIPLWSKGEELEFYKSQKETYISLLESKEMYHAIVSSRQTGKSTLLGVYILTLLFSNQDENILFIAPELNKAKEILEPKVFEILLKLNEILEKSKKGVRFKVNRLDVSAVKQVYNSKLKTWENKNFIIAKGALREDSTRGLTVNKIIIDEAAFISNKAYEVAIKTIQSFIGKYQEKYKTKVIVASTPQFKEGFFYDIYKRAIDGQKNHKTYFLKYQETPFYDEEYVKEESLKLSRLSYKTDILGEFLDSDEGGAFHNYNFINIESVMKNNDMHVPKYVSEYKSYYSTKTYNGVNFCCIDLSDGKITSDYIVFNVMTVINERFYQINLRLVKSTDTNFLLDVVKDIKQKYNPVFIGETNNNALTLSNIKSIVGNSFISHATNKNREDLIKELFSNVSDFREEVNGSKCILNLLDTFEVREQFENFVGVNVKGKIKYQARVGFNDDIVMSCTFLFPHWKSNLKRSRGLMMVNNSNVWN